MNLSTRASSCGRVFTLKALGVQSLRYVVNTFYSESIPWLLGSSNTIALFLPVTCQNPMSPDLRRDLSNRAIGDWQRNREGVDVGVREGNCSQNVN